MRKIKLSVMAKKTITSTGIVIWPLNCQNYNLFKYSVLFSYMYIYFMFVLSIVIIIYALIE